MNGLTPIDTLTYGSQTADVSYGRCPDGEDDWGFMDPTPEAGNDTVGVAVQYDPNSIPDKFFLAPNYPNPFNPQTTIRFGLPAQARLNLSVYNVQGQRSQTL